MSSSSFFVVRERNKSLRRDESQKCTNMYMDEVMIVAPFICARNGSRRVESCSYREAQKQMMICKRRQDCFCRQCCYIHSHIPLAHNPREIPKSSIFFILIRQAYHDLWIGLLLVSHLRLVLVNSTTYESIKGRRWVDNSVHGKPFYARYYVNCFRFFFRPDGALSGNVSGIYGRLPNQVGR